MTPGEQARQMFHGNQQARHGRCQACGECQPILTFALRPPPRAFCWKMQASPPVFERPEYRDLCQRCMGITIAERDAQDDPHAAEHWRRREAAAWKYENERARQLGLL